MTDFTVVDQLLNDRTFYIEFNTDPNLTGPAFPTDRMLPSAKNLSNHAKHAVVALAGLGVPLVKIKEYYDNYTALTPYGYPLDSPKASEHVISEENWEKFIGGRTSFEGYCDFFDRKEKELGLDGLLRRYVPPLLPGWVGAFTHAAIHLGWALDANNRWMTIEGLAYLAFSYVSCHPERATPLRGDELAVDSLLRIAGVWESDHEALRRWVVTLVASATSDMAAGMHPDLAGLQYRIASVLGEGHSLIYQTPAWIDDQDAPVSWEQLYYLVTLLYLTMPGDFILLHLLTSLHAMEQIADRLPCDQQRYAVKCYWIGILSILFSRAEFPSRTKLMELHSRFADAVDDGGSPVQDEEWGRIIARAVDQVEEHNPKLVYVLRRVWRRIGHRSIYRVAAGHFTPTPEALKS